MKGFAKKTFAVTRLDLISTEKPRLEDVPFTPLPELGEADESSGFRTLRNSKVFEVRNGIYAARFFLDLRRTSKEHDELMEELAENEQHQIDEATGEVVNSWKEAEKYDGVSKTNNMIATDVTEIYIDAHAKLVWLATSSDGDIGRIIADLRKAGVRVKSATPWARRDLPSPRTFLGKLDPGWNVKGALALKSFIKDERLSLAEKGGRFTVIRMAQRGLAQKVVTKNVGFEFDREIKIGGELKNAAVYLHTTGFVLNALSWRLSKVSTGASGTCGDVDAALGNLWVVCDVYQCLDDWFIELEEEGMLDLYDGDITDLKKAQILEIKEAFGRSPGTEEFAKFMTELANIGIELEVYESLLLRWEDEEKAKKAGVEPAEQAIIEPDGSKSWEPSKPKKKNVFRKLFGGRA